MLLPLMASADAIEINGIYYNLNAEDKTAEVTQNPNKYSGEVTIPNSVTYGEVIYSVTSIGEYAFDGCIGLTSVTIPNSVTSILFGAFESCSSLTSLTIPNSVASVRFHAFDGTAWYNNQPDGLVYAGSCAYKYKGEMPANTTISIKEGTKGITDCAFEECNGMTSITIPNSLTFIGNGTFRGCSGLTSITIPNSVTSIGSQAFMCCNNLTSVKIPNNVIYIGDQALMGCDGLTSIVVESGNTVYDSHDNCNAIIKTASNILIAGCKATIIPDGVTSIGRYAFKDCIGLTSVTIPNSVTSIGEYAFDSCSGLTSVIIPNSVISIVDRAFQNCIGLTSMTIPNSVISIGDAFSGCSGLTSLVVEAGNTAYDSRNDCNAIVETASNSLIVGCKTTVIPNSVTSIGRYAFVGCSGLTSITIPSSVISIDWGAFYGCSGLTSITIPNSVTSIDDYVFCNCSSLASVTIPNSVTSVGQAAFSFCSGLTSITIPNSVASIGDFAFSNCSGLTSITIPSNVTFIGNYAFAECRSLTSVTSLATTPPQAKDDSFSKYDIPLYVPNGARDAYLAASPWYKFKEIIDNTDVDEITIKDIGKTTWCSEYDLDFTNVTGIKAYTATGYDDIDKTIWLTRVMKVPAGTGILVKGDAGTYKIPHVNVRAYYTNMLVGNVGEAIKIEETDGDKTNYYLSGKDGTFVSVNGNANIGKNKAYLQLPTSVFAGTRSIGINYDDEDGTTGINVQSSMFNVQSDNAYYTLQGQRVQNPGKGLYIYNGRKVVIRSTTK